MKSLLIGAGHARNKFIQPPETGSEWHDLVTLDINPDAQPDVIWDLKETPLPFDDEEFDEIHAYEVLEHIYYQGDTENFFKEWNEYYRILKPGGYFCGSVPSHDTIWAYGDPDHKRVIIPEATFIYLSQREYDVQLGKTAMSDYRRYLNCDFELTYVDRQTSDVMVFFALKKVSDETV